jgi:hypothetical protein
MSCQAGGNSRRNEGAVVLVANGRHSLQTGSDV